MPYLDVTATRDEDGRRVVLGVTNRHPARAAQATVILAGFGGMRPVRAQTLAGPDPLATNDFEAPERVCVRRVPLPEGDGSQFRFRSPPASVTVLELERIE